MKTFIYMVSHDLRAPLTIIQRLCALAAGAPDRERDPVMPMSIEAIGRAVKRMDVMIDDLVMAARLEGGQLPLTRVAIELPAWLPDFLERSAAVLDPRRLRVEMPATLPHAARRPRPPGAHSHQPALQRAEILRPGHARAGVRYSRRDSAIRFAVTDQGRGIAPEHVRHLFEKFYRAGSSRKAEGIGLGLYITHLLVEAHGGRIWVESEVGKGSTFYVTLPMTECDG